MISYDVHAPKKAANLTVNSDLLVQAKDFNINLSSIFEAALSAELSRIKREQWKSENADAIGSYNKFIAENGLFSDGLRSF